MSNISFYKSFFYRIIMLFEGHCKKLCFKFSFLCILFLSVFINPAPAFAKGEMIWGNYPENQLSIELIAGRKLYLEKKYKEARLSFDSLCSQNDAIACNYVGQMYQYSEGGPKDEGLANKIYSKSCDLNDGLGCALVADLKLSKSDQNNKDDKDLEEVLSKSCFLHFQHSCKILGDLFYLNGYIIYGGFLEGFNNELSIQSRSIVCKNSLFKNCEAASKKYISRKKSAYSYAEDFEKACILNSPVDCHNLGKILEASEIDEEFTKGISKIYSACKMDFMPSCYYSTVENLVLVKSYYEDDRPQGEIEQDIVDKFCRQNVFDFCYWSAKNRMLNYSVEEPQSERKLSNLEYACNQGHAKSCNLLVVYKAKLKQNEIDYEAAFDSFSKGCELNDAASCYDIGAIHWNGVSSKSSKSLAQKYFQKSCNLKLSEGCYGLALALSKANLASNESNLVNEYFIIACQNHYQACFQYTILFGNPESKQYDSVIKKSCLNESNIKACRILLEKTKKLPDAEKRNSEINDINIIIENASIKSLEFPHLIELND